jgi:DNA polymerase III delta subunit
LGTFSKSFRDLEVALWNRDLSSALHYGKVLSDSGIRPEMIIPVFERIFKTLLMAHLYVKKGARVGDDLYALLGMRGKTQKENFSKGFRSYSPKEIAGSFQKIVQTDFDVKTGALGGPESLSLLICNICGVKESRLAFR